MQPSDESSEDESDDYQGAVERCAEQLNMVDPISSSCYKNSTYPDGRQSEPFADLSNLSSVYITLKHIFFFSGVRF